MPWTYVDFEQPLFVLIFPRVRELLLPVDERTKLLLRFLVLSAHCNSVFSYELPMCTTHVLSLPCIPVKRDKG